MCRGRDARPPSALSIPAGSLTNPLQHCMPSFQVSPSVEETPGNIQPKYRKILDFSCLANFFYGVFQMTEAFELGLGISLQI